MYRFWVKTPREQPRTDPAKLGLKEAAAEIERLSAEINRHDHLYHVEAAPEIGDSAYDALFRRLQALEAAHPSLLAPDSPTQRVGADPREALPSVEHAVPMLSLDSAHELAAVRRFDERLRKALGDEDIRYVLEPKLDGASLELVYVNGILDRAVTRGNGLVGEGVTENARTIPSVPLRLREDERPAPRFLSVRGEAIMYLSDFEDPQPASHRSRGAAVPEPPQRDVRCTAPARFADHGQPPADGAGVRRAQGRRWRVRDGLRGTRRVEGVGPPHPGTDRGCGVGGCDRRIPPRLRRRP